MSALILAECAGGELSAASRAAIGGAAPLAPLTVLVCGDGAPAAAQQAANLSHVGHVLVLEVASAGSSASALPRSEALAPLLVQQVRQFGSTHLVAAGTQYARAVLPRAAALLDVMPLSEVVRIVDESTFVRPVHAGAGLMTLRSNDACKVLTLRASAFVPASAGAAAAAAIESLNLGDVTGPAAELIEVMRPSSDGLPELGGARIVLSGGRGVGSAEGYARLQSLARLLGASLGASRAAVDAGFAPANAQVGQTGKSVAPDLYIACGISGAVQHLAGMKDAKCIVAINSDKDAPIFEVADFGLVADLFEALPQLEAELGGLRHSDRGREEITVPVYQPHQLRPTLV
jgi:electron transfer flavoprotein alpha subunit